ncbi:MAG: hypothetical protein AB7O65_04310 [Candidatus Korobacteraceae bacterium]
MAVWLAEVLVEAVLFSCFLGVLVSSQTGFFNGIIGSVLAVPVILFINGYYLTRALAGVAWRSGSQWLYPLLAAAVFMGHVYFAVSNSTGSFTPLARAAVIPFLTGGTCIVFACASAGNWLFQKWSGWV